MLKHEIHFKNNDKLTYFDDAEVMYSFKVQQNVLEVHQGFYEKGRPTAYKCRQIAVIPHTEYIRAMSIEYQPNTP